MILAGLQKNSFIDYPGKISCVLFTTGCNFVCPYCHNADLAKGEYPMRIDTAEVMAFLRSRRGMLEGVVISGGEPTLDKGLIDLCREVKSLGYSIKIDSNGSRPDVLRQLLARRLVDYIAMDIKAPLDDYDRFCRNPRIHETLTTSIRLVMQSAPVYEFRTTCALPFVNPAAVESIVKKIEGAACYVLQAFNHRAEYLDPDFNRRQDPRLSAEEMQRLQTIANPFVQRCIIR